MADEADKPDVIDAAGHRISSGYERSLRELSRNHHLSLELNILPLIPFAGIHGIQVPQAEFLIRDHNRVRTQIKRRLGFPDIDLLPLIILKCANRLIVYRLYRSAEHLQIHVCCAPVENDELGIHKDITHHLPHILEIDLKGRSVHQRNDLRQLPTLCHRTCRKLHGIPGAVELDKNTLWFMSFLQKLKL